MLASLALLVPILLLPDFFVVRRGPVPTVGGTSNIVYKSGGSTVCASGSELSSYACGSTITVTTGWTTYVWCSGYNAVTVTSVTDGANTYTPVTSSLSNGGNANGRLFRASNVTGGTYTVTCNYSAAAFPGMAVLSYSGVNTSSPNDGTNTASGSASNAPDAGTISTTNANDLILACATTDHGSGSLTWTEPSGFTLRQNYGNASVSTTFACAERITTATGTYGSAWSISASPNWIAAIAAEKSQ